MQKFLISVAAGLALLGTGIADAQDFALYSQDLGVNLTQSQVFSGFGCKGKNLSPALTWGNAPSNTKSFAVTVYDPDAPTGSGWWHWLIFNIPADVQALKADAGRVEANLAPTGSIQSLTDFGKPGFGGACPPRGDKVHRYIFTVYALNTVKLNLTAETKPATVESALNNHAIAKAYIISHYQQ